MRKIRTGKQRVKYLDAEIEHHWGSLKYNMNIDFAETVILLFMKKLDQKVIKHNDLTNLLQGVLNLKKLSKPNNKKINEIIFYLSEAKSVLELNGNPL